MKILIIHHSADWDGWVSAAIAKDYLKGCSNVDITMRPMNYGDKTPENLESYDSVYVLDFSLPEEDMLRIADKLVWIDHHKAVINKLFLKLQEHKHFSYALDTESQMSAAELAWQLFHDPEDMPKTVKYISAYDVFNKVRPDILWENAIAFQCYMRTLPFSYTNAEVFNMDKRSREIALLIGHGILDNKTVEEERAFKSFAQNISVDGYRGKLLFTTDMSSLACANEVNKTDFVFLVNRIPDTHKYRVSIRVGEQSDFDACAYAQKHEGGGHVKASGCMLSEEEINNLINQ